MTIIGQVTANELIETGHQGGFDSGRLKPLHIEQYGGEVEHQILKDSIMRKFFKFKSIRGTDTVTNMRMGVATLQKVVPGIRPDDHSPTFDNISIKVDTIVLARSNQHLLNDFVDHIDTRREVGIEHGKKIGSFFDESFITQGIKAAQITNVDPDGLALGGWEDVDTTGSKPANIVRTAPKGFQGGNVIQLAAVLDEIDPEELDRAIQDMCQKAQEKDVDIMEAVLLIPWAQYYVLLRNDKLLSKDFSSNGDYSAGKVLAANGVRLEPTNRFPKASDVGQTHFLSNAGNGFAYDVTATEVEAVALLLMPKALLAGETIPLTSKVHYSDTELQWFIDSYLAYAVTPNRSEMAGCIFKFRE